MAFPCMDDEHAGVPSGFKQPADNRNDVTRRRYVVTEQLSESTRGTEVILHIDHDNRRTGRVKFECVR
ncbi:hypothetical protein D3C73_1644260 [compost metagenome]